MQKLDLITPVVLSGGSGTRLWPLSRTSRPKQFVKVASDQTLFEATLQRLSKITSRKPVVVTNVAHRFLVAEHLRTSAYMSGTILVEPFGRNTAPAIAFAALKASETDPEAMLLICPADHDIQEMDKFTDAIEAAIPESESGHIVTFGVVPTRADTGYGYIEVDSADQRKIKAFVEKPEQAIAEKFLESGTHFWNSGIFLVKASVILQQLQLLNPKIHDACVHAWERSSKDTEFINIEPQAFLSCPSISIDYAVMEKTRSARMVPLNCTWSDLGTWESVWRCGQKDEDGNVVSGDVKLLKSTNNYVRSQDKLVTIVGCDDLVVIESGDSILVSSKEATDDIKTLVDQLISENRKEAIHHPRVFRPWGNYEGVVTGDRYQVKKIVVNPGEKLSLQKHFHRAEHWIVVRGIALITCGDEEKLVSENQSTYIPLGEIHRLENPGKIPLELIEVQSGSYLGEDDIVRLEDIYGRQPTDVSDVKDNELTLLKTAG